MDLHLGNMTFVIFLIRFYTSWYLLFQFSNVFGETYQFPNQKLILNFRLKRTQDRACLLSIRFSYAYKCFILADNQLTDINFDLDCLEHLRHLDIEYNKITNLNNQSLQTIDRIFGNVSSGRSINMKAGISILSLIFCFPRGFNAQAQYK